MILASPDGLWLAIRAGRMLELFAATGGTTPVARIELERDDVDLTFVGTPSSLVAVFHDPPRLVLFSPPQLETVARLDLPAPAKLVASTGSRLALVSPDGKQLTVARATGKGLAAAPLDPGSPVEVAVGLEKNQLLLALYKKLQVWDAVSGRPQLNLALQLPPPPRLVGAAQGHLWAVRTGTDEVIVYRLSDGRPFKHRVHRTIEDVVSHPSSPLLVVQTQDALVRLHCFAHQVGLIGSPWTKGMPLALLVAGENVTLVGAASGVPW
ncbi:MAG: hypothetical protein KIT31_41595, partial [Deltaproteobacteria bacterium]|nr:hypothetical protein [Deltaproteobacteria bacterium]